jgi:hypothetical protein
VQCNEEDRNHFKQVCFSLRLDELCLVNLKISPVLGLHICINLLPTYFIGAGIAQWCSAELWAG